MRKLTYLVLTLVMICGALGCALFRNLSGFTKPQLDFDRAELKDISLNGITVDLHFLLKNDNPIGIKLASLAYNFAVENHPFVSGHPPNGLQIRANGVSDLSFPAHVEFRDLASTLEVFLQKDVAHYTASGSIGVDTPIGVINFPVSHSGSFDVPKVPTISIQAPTLNNLSFSGAHLTIPIALQNRNGFPLPFGGLNTQVTVAGAQVFAPSIPAQSALAAHEQRVVNLGVDVNFASAGLAVANALRSRRAEIGLRGNMNVGGLSLPVNLSQAVNFR